MSDMTKTIISPGPDVKMLEAALILAPSTAWFSGKFFATATTGVVATDLVSIGGSPLPVLGLLLITAPLAWWRNPEVLP